MRALIDKKLLCSLYVTKRLSLTKISEYLEENHKIKIPMYGTIPSLNVSVSASILMYEYKRQLNV